jgi:hypothetical protein
MLVRFTICTLALTALAFPITPLVQADDAKPAAPTAAKSPAKTSDAPKPDKDGWYSLFNGKDFTGWKINENKETFRIEDGAIVANGSPSHAFYVGPVENADFKNFELQADVLAKPKSNGGIYFHTKFQKSGWPAHGLECQINNTHPDPRKTGSFYRAADVMDDSPAKDNEWFQMHAIVDGQRLVMKINGKVVNDHVEPENPSREPGWEKNVISHGTFALQGHDPGSEVHFKNIKVKPLP